MRDKNNKDKTEMEKNEEWKGNTLAGETSYLNLRKTTTDNRNSFTKGWFTKPILTDEKFLI